MGKPDCGRRWTLVGGAIEGARFIPLALTLKALRVSVDDDPSTTGAG